MTGLVLAGSAKLKLSQSGLFDPHLSPIVVKIVDVSYGGENGFNQVWLVPQPAGCFFDSRLGIIW